MAHTEHFLNSLPQLRLGTAMSYSPDLRNPLHFGKSTCQSPQLLESLSTVAGKLVDGMRSAGHVGTGEIVLLCTAMKGKLPESGLILN